MISAIGSTLIALALLLAGVRWLKVAQLEHYLPGRVTRIALLWLRVVPAAAALLAVGIVLVILGVVVPWLHVIGIAALALSPLGLLTWPLSHPPARTPRLWRAVAILAALVIVITVPLALVLGWQAGGLALIALPFLADLALLIAQRLEDRLAAHFVTEAQAKLDRIAPTVVAITGSYGKTSTKNYVAELVGTEKFTVASPASFNNLMGLCRTVNDRLQPGTEVFVAEMGAYGPGEIRDLCRTFPPRIAAITTIGEAHLERMGSKEAIAAAKLEIAEQAGVVVVNVDSPELAAWADAHPERMVVRCATTDADVDVAVVPVEGGWEVLTKRESLGVVAVPANAHAGNVAVALGIALALGIDLTSLVNRIPGLQGAPHRAETQEINGITVIDDTYNSNPEGAAKALADAHAIAKARGGTVYTITPGMVEFGATQASHNHGFAQAATAHPDMFLAITRRVNRAALASGAHSGRFATYATREEAAAAVQGRAKAGDVILYENDLPVHYP